MQLVWNSNMRNCAAQTWRSVLLGVTLGLGLSVVAWLGLARLSGSGAAFWQLVGLAAGTLISEDLATIQAGVLIAQGRLGWLAGTGACFAGIWLGDLLLFAAGRYLGRAVLARAPLKWFLTEAAVERSSAWLQERGLLVIALSRFVPGTRLPTYFAAGVLRTDWRWFALYFGLACAVWTPLLIALAGWLGGAASARLLAQGYAHWGWLLLVAVGLYALWKLVWWSLPRAGRPGTWAWRSLRRWLGWWRRWTRWEFWPPYLFYPPVVLYVFYLGWKYRCLTLFTAVNPAIPASGFVGESKADILAGLAHAPERVARFLRLPVGGVERAAPALGWLAAQGLRYPIVLKPDVGQRGAGVQIVRSEIALRDYLAAHTAAVLVQEYIAGEEFGVFYFRWPGRARGEVFSLTHKTFPVLTGDGESTLETLVLKDARAVCLWRLYHVAQAARWHEILPAGERLQLVELGSHCRGAIFLDGAPYLTPALAAALEELSQGFAGFAFGRYDLRAASVAAFQRGEFTVLELNGVTAEATHIYDPQHSLWQAYRTLFAQWRTAFAIGAAQRARGAKVTDWRELVRLVWAFRQQSRNA